jgi:hypothetical protein
MLGNPTSGHVGQVENHLDGSLPGGATTSNLPPTPASSARLTDRPENFGIYQINEEHVSILSLVDVEVAFQNTVPDANRKVSLFQLDSLLEDVIAKPEERSIIKAQIRNVLEHVRDYQGQPRSIVVDDPGQPGGMIVNKELESRYELKNADGSVRRILSVPGVIMNDWRKILLKAGSTVVVQIV